jgi:hypothetical protein
VPLFRGTIHRYGDVRHGEECADVRLYELAYCCHVFVVLAGDDGATNDLQATTGRTVDPSKPEHAAALLTWLRRWGCRQFAVADEAIARESLAGWWSAWGHRLPPPKRTVVELGERELDAIAGAYDDLRVRRASWQRRADGKVAKTFGATGTAKALYAIRPNACPPWDEPIRRRLGFGESGEGYRRQLVRSQAELAEAAADLGPGGFAAEIPAAIGRPGTSLAKLVDEHDWVRFTHGTEPPPPELFERWATYARRAASSRSAS